MGESDAEHDEGKAHPVCHSQISGSVPKAATAANTVLAYEPVWAIGTGKTPTSDEIAAMHAHLRRCLVDRLGDRGTDIKILYGGSVNAGNAAELLAVAEVGGALVGGASLTAESFAAIIAAAAALLRTPDRHRKYRDVSRSLPISPRVFAREATNSAFTAMDGKICHSSRRGAWAVADRSGSPTYAHSAVVRTSTRTLASLFCSALQASEGVTSWTSVPPIVTDIATAPAMRL